MLRKCRVCGLEANTKSELELFTKSKTGKHGRVNICLECSIERSRIYREENREKHNASSLRYYHENKEEINKKSRKKRKRRIVFKDKRIILDKNPRTNICSMCGKKYPEDLKTQTSIHHLYYDKDDPLKGTVEVCQSCHLGLHRGELVAGRKKYGRITEINGDKLTIIMDDGIVDKLIKINGSLRGKTVRIIVNKDMTPY